MRRCLFVLVLAAVPAAAFTQTRKPVECYCTGTTGERHEMGDTLCLSVGGRSFMARCEMSLNVPMWRDTKEDCVTG